MSYGCQTKYSSFDADISKLTCAKKEQAQIWEDSVGLLVDDQKAMYGCMNTDCCK